MKNWYEMNHQEVLDALHSGRDGLNEAEVKKSGQKRDLISLKKQSKRVHWRYSYHSLRIY